jgi:hypothetical protein
MNGVGSKIKKIEFENQVAPMAADFQIPAELQRNNENFSQTESDGLKVEEEVQMTPMNLQYISDENGAQTAVIVPIELWREIESEKETAYLLKSKRMKTRLLAAKNRRKGIPFEEALEKLGI